MVIGIKFDAISILSVFNLFSLCLFFSIRDGLRDTAWINDDLIVFLKLIGR